MGCFLFPLWLFHYNLKKASFKEVVLHLSLRVKFIHLIMHPIDETERPVWRMNRLCSRLCFKVDMFLFYITCSYYRRLKTAKISMLTTMTDCRYIHFTCISYESSIKHGLIFSKWGPVYFLNKVTFLQGCNTSI